MGLDTSHGCWHGAYSAFGRWREEVAKAAGFYVWPIKMDDGRTLDTIMLEWHRYGEAELAGEWAETPHEPLIVLFAHSDCGGVIKPEQARPLADKLEALLPAMRELGDGHGHISAGGGFVGCTERFVTGLREAAEAGENVEFR